MWRPSIPVPCVSVCAARSVPACPARAAGRCAPPPPRGQPSATPGQRGIPAGAPCPRRAHRARRNPHYRDAANVAIERVVHLAITDLATELNLYRAGDLDLTSEVPNTQLESLRREHPAELRLAPYLSTYAYAVNLARLPDARARKALAMAVDRDRITRQITGAGERPAFGWVPDGIPGYAPARFEWQDLPYAETATRARESSGRRPKPPARRGRRSRSAPTPAPTTIARRSRWQTCGERRSASRRKSSNSNGTCISIRATTQATATWCVSGGRRTSWTPKPSWTCSNRAIRRTRLGIPRAAYDGLLAKSRTETDSAKRMELLARAEQQLLSDVPVIPIFFRASKRLVKPYVEGYQANPLEHVASRDLRLNSR